MNRVDRGSSLLSLAGILLVLAVMAFLISESEGSRQRKESARRSQEALRIQRERAITDRRVYDEENDQRKKDRARLVSQQDAIIKSLKRIEEALETAAPPGVGR